MSYTIETSLLGLAAVLALTTVVCRAPQSLNRNRQPTPPSPPSAPGSPTSSTWQPGRRR